MDPCEAASSRLARVRKDRRGEAISGTDTSVNDGGNKAIRG